MEFLRLKWGSWLAGLKKKKLSPSTMHNTHVCMYESRQVILESFFNYIQPNIVHGLSCLARHTYVKQYTLKARVRELNVLLYFFAETTLCRILEKANLIHCRLPSYHGASVHGKSLREELETVQLAIGFSKQLEKKNPLEKIYSFSALSFCFLGKKTGEKGRTKFNSTRHASSRTSRPNY